LSGQVLLTDHLKVTGAPTLKERDGLAASNALYHLPASLSAYGDVTGYDLGSPVGLLEYVVDFVNRPQTKVTLERHGTKLDGEPVFRAADQLRVRGREKLRRLLLAAVTDDPDFANPSEDFIRERTGGIHWEHRLEHVPGGAGWRHHAHILDADAFYNLIASLLMSAEHRQALAQCAPCGRFFMVEKPVKGRPQSVYHDEKCRRAANDAGAAARQRASRTRKAALKILGASKASKTEPKAAIKRAQLEYPEATAEQLANHAKIILKGARKRK
jgi:hypothetical protein